MKKAKEEWQGKSLILNKNPMRTEIKMECVTIES